MNIVNICHMNGILMENEKGYFQGTFRENLVDGRVINSLTKKDIERHLSVVDKSHQVGSIKGRNHIFIKVLLMYVSN